MKEIVKKLKSRKLWVAIAGIATGVAIILGVDGNDINTVAGAVTALVSVITYIVTEGKIDAEGVKNAIEKADDAIEVITGENETNAEKVGF